MKLIEIIQIFNTNQFWCQTCVVKSFKLRATSFDRLLYLFLHRFELLGSQDRRVFQSYVKPGMNVVDIGANIGLCSLICAGLVGPQGNIYAFEPVPVLYDSMVQNIRCNKLSNIFPYNTALGKQADQMILCRSVLNSGDNRLTTAGGLALLEDCHVRVEKLDSILTGVRIDFIKMDVQGWEVDVVKGMHQILVKNPGIVVYFEFWPRGLRLSGHNPLELLSLFKKHKLSIFQTNGHREKEICDFDKLISSTKGDRIVNFIAKSY